MRLDLGRLRKPVASGFTSAANYDLQARSIDQIGGALQQLNGDGSVDAAGTQATLANLKSQLGGQFAQRTVSNDLHTQFIADDNGGFAVQLFEMAAAVMVSYVLGPEMFAFYNALIDPIALAATSSTLAVLGSAAATGLAAGTTALAAGAVGQLITTGNVNLKQDIEGAGVTALTAGLTQGLLGSTGISNLGNGITQGTPGITLANLPQTALNIGEQSLIGAGAQVAIEGGSFGKALIANVANDTAAVGANAIGNAESGLMNDLGPVGGELAYVGLHSALGCAASAAEGTGCGGGAIGGAASAIVNPIIDANGNIPPAVLAGIETLVGGSVAGALGYNVQGAMTAAQNETLNNWAAHVGLALSFTVPGTPLAFSGGVGLVADDKGNVGWYTVANQKYAPGVGIGGDGSIGLSVGAYPGATTINDYGGPFNNASVGAGAGPYGSIDVFQDPSKSPLNPASYGGGLTIGVGVGGGGSVMRTDTKVHPIGKGSGQ